MTQQYAQIFWFIWSRLTLEFSCFKKDGAVPSSILNQTWNVYNWSRQQRSDIRKANSQRIDKRNQMVNEFFNISAFILHFTLFVWFLKSTIDSGILQESKKSSRYLVKTQYAWNAFGPLIGCTTSLDFSKVIHPKYYEYLKKGAYRSHLGRKKFGWFLAD